MTTPGERMFLREMERELNRPPAPQPEDEQRAEDNDDASE